LSRRNAVKADAKQFSNHKRSEFRLGKPLFSIKMACVLPPLARSANGNPRRGMK